MTKFKFFRGYVGTINVMDGQTYATASLYDPHHEIITQEQYNLNRDMFAEHERVRRRRIDTDNQIRLFQATTVTTVNPKWWMKVKMFYQKFKYNSVIETNSEALIIFLITTSITIGVGFIIAKIFGA